MTDAAGGAEPRVYRSRGFRATVSLIIVILAIQLGTSVVGAILAMRSSEAVAKDTFSFVADITAERVARYGEAATYVVEGMALEMERTESPASLEDVASSLYERLSAKPQVRAAYVGFIDGRFVSVARQGPGYTTRIIDLDPERTVTVTERDSTFAVVGSEVVLDSYDPRTRPWYITGATSTSSQWTEPYVQVISQNSAVSVAHAVRPVTALQAVVGADLSLEAMAEVLDELPVGEGAEAFVMSQDRRIIAAPSRYAAQIADLSAQTQEVPFASELGVTTDNQVRANSTEDVFGMNGDRMTLERVFPDTEDLNWVLHLEAYPSQLSPGLGDVQKVVLWVSITTTLLVVAAAFVLYRALEPLRQLRRSASTDPLTGLANRAELARRGARLMESAAEAGDRVIVVMMDLDRFKNLNDEHGHEAGDKALNLMANALRSATRDRDIVARLGGDEFAMVLRQVRDGNPQMVVERIRAYVEYDVTHGIVGGESVGVTAGYAVGEGPGLVLADLLRAADEALIAGKRETKGATYVSPWPQEPPGSFK